MSSLTAIGDISHPSTLHHVRFTPRVAANLLSMGQLVDNNCRVSFYQKKEKRKTAVSFSRAGYVVQGKVIGKGPKCWTTLCSE